MATRKDALNRQETYQYDPAGNLTQFTDRKNQQNTSTYDSLNRRTGTSYQDGSSTSFTYDSVGRLVRATDSVAGAIEFGYDTLDRLSQETTPQGTVTYQYDVLGRRSQMTANGQQAVTYGYDAASRLTQVAQGSQVVGISYDNANRRTSLAYPNGTSTTYGYDNASRLTNIVHNGPSGLIESLSYVYDAAGNRISLARTNGAASNLPAAVQAAYDAANEQIQFNAGSPNQTFDANGNLTSDGTSTYTWDARNRLVSISGGVTAGFSYDALGRRISKTVNGVTTSYLYDGKDIVQEIGGSAVGANYIRSLNIDEPFVRQTATGNEFYHVDALGSTLDLTNQTGAVQTSYQYEAFGKTTVTGTSSNPFQYTGRENDGTGLYYYRARYYSPQLQRFTAEDPSELRGGDVNFYAYALHNPFRYTDPSGEIVPIVVLCLRGAGTSIVDDLISGRKVNLGDAVIGCATGGLSKAKYVKKLAEKKKGGRRGRGHEGHPAGESKKAEAAAKQAGVPEKNYDEFKQRIEDFKTKEGRGGDDNLTFQQLRQIATELAQEIGQRKSSSGEGAK